ncbi:hypothetical protein GCM10008960_25980 [Deinococcus sedimenti]|uniref:Uncharacterized protein n=2 Tax=Deinococcus sedimenti TaxID=1867090 RepID=A0ABQ2S618_9DEIO|nr:hypothetical protein GCM10008960_25980 [Deinococcus sedimenti]
MNAPAQTERLRRRNDLWQQLRTTEPGSVTFERTLTELGTLTGWERRRILAGLGLQEDHGER